MGIVITIVIGFTAYFAIALFWFIIIGDWKDFKNRSILDYWWLLIWPICLSFYLTMFAVFVGACRPNGKKE